MGGSYSRAPEVQAKWYPELMASLPSQAGKTFVVTGTTSGTGYVFAKTAAALGGRVLLLNRPSERADNALKSLQEEVPDGLFIPVNCDLQSFASVRDAAKQVAHHCQDEGVDVLCNNAGVMALKDQATDDGYDVQMQTNHLSHFLLTKELFSLLQKASEKRGEARIVHHSSAARKTPMMKLTAKYLEKNGGNLGGDKDNFLMGGTPRWQRYQQTKLANCVFTYALHERLSAKYPKIKATVAHPGLSATNLQVATAKDGGMSTGFITSLIMYFSQSVEDGALGIITCGMQESVESGDFYGPGTGMLAITGPAKKLEPEPFLKEPEAMSLLWEKSCDAIGEAWDL